jgi:hypothetical protein
LCTLDRRMSERVREYDGTLVPEGFRKLSQKELVQLLKQKKEDKVRYYPIWGSGQYGNAYLVEEPGPYNAILEFTKRDSEMLRNAFPKQALMGPFKIWFSKNRKPRTVIRVIFLIRPPFFYSHAQIGEGAESRKYELKYFLHVDEERRIQCIRAVVSKNLPFLSHKLLVRLNSRQNKETFETMYVNLEYEPLAQFLMEIIADAFRG